MLYERADGVRFQRSKIIHQDVFVTVAFLSDVIVRVDSDSTLAVAYGGKIGCHDRVVLRAVRAFIITIAIVDGQGCVRS